MMTTEGGQLGGGGRGGGGGCGGRAGEAIRPGAGRDEDCCGQWIIRNKLLEIRLIRVRTMFVRVPKRSRRGQGSTLDRRGTGLREGQELDERGAEREAREGHGAREAWATAGLQEPQNPPMPHTVGVG